MYTDLNVIYRDNFFCFLIKFIIVENKFIAKN